MTDQRPHIRVNVFPGGINWGLYVAIDRGIFARHGIDEASWPRRTRSLR